MYEDGLYEGSFSEPIEETLINFSIKNYHQISNSMKRVFFKAIKKEYNSGLIFYFYRESRIMEIIKEIDYEFFCQIRDLFKD